MEYRFYVLRKFRSTIVTAVYISPYANAKLAMKELHANNLSKTAYPEAAFFIAGDFNNTNLKTVLLKFYQHTRGNKTLDRVYTKIAEALKPLPSPI